MKRRWTEQEAWSWWGKTPWIRGVATYPANCLGSLDTWQEYDSSKKLDEFDKEFELMESLGMNAIRIPGSFDCWLDQHDSFMEIFESILTLADKHHIKVMYIFASDCTIPESKYQLPTYGKMDFDFGYHAGKMISPHTGDYTEKGKGRFDICPDKFLDYVKEIGTKYANDDRIQIWNVWNEIGNSNRGDMSVELLRKAYQVLRSCDVKQPLTSDIWSYWADGKDIKQEELIAAELSDIISFHYYSYPEQLVILIKDLKSRFNRPLICDEWLNRIEGNTVENILPIFYLEKIGSYNWGLIQGVYQAYEPWGQYYIRYKNGEKNIPINLWQHDLFHACGIPYCERDIEIIKKLTKATKAECKNIK